ncbi:MAG TPA: hypothetical protein VKF38_09235 [Anaerolineaceae bacterium]|nr:hypothetical protein [Anaerolineaceae bacterium]
MENKDDAVKKHDRILRAGLGEVAIAELSIQTPMRIANGLAAVSTALALVADTKAGNTVLEKGIIGTRVANSVVTTMRGYAIPEAYISFVGQTITLTNDLGWTSLPYSNWDH